MRFRLLLLTCAAVLVSGCIHVKLDPVQVHATVDVNVKVDREVSGLLTDIYGDSETIKVPQSSAR